MMDEIIVYQGDSKELNFTIVVNNIPMDITGGKVFFAAKEDFDDKKYTISPREATITDGPLGKLSVSLSPEETDRTKNLVAELEYRNTTLKKTKTLWQGTISFKNVVITPPPVISINVVGVPKSATTINSISVKIESRTAVSYRHKLSNVSPWETEMPVSVPIAYDNLSSGNRELYIWCKSDEGLWEDEDSAKKYTWSIYDVSSKIISDIPVNGTDKDYLLEVGGLDIAAYKYKIDSTAWGLETDTSEAIFLSALSTGTHSLYIVGKNKAGKWQDESNATVYTWEIQ